MLIGVPCAALSLGLIDRCPARRLAGACRRGGQRAHRCRRHRPHRHRSNISTPRPTASRCRPRPAPTASCAASKCRAREGGTNWAVFALANNGDEQIDRLIVVPHYRMVGSGLLWPDLGLSRVVTITPSSGDRPERQDSATADIFRVTLDPGSVITYRRRTAHRPAAAALSVGARRLQGQGQQRSRSTTASSSASPDCWRCS